MEEYLCDVCNEVPARFWQDAAVCEGCKAPEWKADEVTVLDNDSTDDNMSDMEADADALASAGWGTDEDYGYFGDD